jgi:alpha/beta superfamily hydrolase
MKCAEDAHVVTFDYRGFGESEGSPTDVGVVIDARTVYDWVLAKSNHYSVTSFADL